jgi:hypothetical protein
MADTVPNSSQRDLGDNSLAALHRMSTTAGVSAQEYVAVNLAAVAAVITGLATALIFLSPLWLAVPVVAIVMSIVALQQISHSNGTQTGRLLAWGGIVLAIGITGVQLGGQYMERATKQPLRNEVLATCDALGQALMAEDYQKAWGMFSDQFRATKKIDFKAFRQQLASLQASSEVGKIKSLKSNGLVDVQGGPSAATMIVVNWDKAARVGRYVIVMGKRNGVWQIDDLPLLFPTPMQAPPSGGASGGSPVGPQ